METPFFDPNKSYYENYEEGPFGAFADGKELGTDKIIPFGIAAGPLLNARFVKAALEKGFDYVVYKTVRTREKKANEWPNVVPVKIGGDLSIEQIRNGVVVQKEYNPSLAITNSFGNPSYPVEAWQPDMARSVTYARPGQEVWGMIEGTRWNTSYDDKKFLEDWVLDARLVQETKVKGIEANFSCPNERNLLKKLLCYDAKQSRDIAYAIKNAIGDMPLVAKISYFEQEAELRELVKELGTIVDGFAAINAIQAPVRTEDGKQALPGGEWRLISGICGGPVKWAGLEMVQRLAALREEFGMKYSIVGVGGVLHPEDYHQYRVTGADIVMACTGAMWNPRLAIDIKKSMKE